ncbi:hypothetical protein CQW23_15140 [Capsicum baccatum]|uniref:RNA-dependent RNA polymerase n=1 Tax=Capsicum baccatum TaxID=33114 RepID=A0A2G2WL76_CAPBA|nr:hypothetical protein CQW23_15140 [Capsicum baccatum]
MERDGGETIKVVQLCLAGFPDGISANDIIKCLQKFGHIRRCRLKKSSTPASSFPYFGPIEGKKITHNDKNFQLHAYLQCGENVGKAVIKAAAIGDIDMDNKILRLVGDCNEITKLPSMCHDVTFKLGYLAEEDSFLSTWGPCNPTRFLVDENAKTCQVLFDEDIAFFLKDECRYALIRCNLKIEFSITEVSFISKFIEDSNGIILLEMASSPCIFYRTAEDDILEVDPCDAITDDDDPWIRTTDCTPLNSFGSQNVYCVKAAVSDMEKMLKYFSGIRMIRVGDKLDIKILDANNELRAPFCCTEVTEMKMDGIFWMNAFMHKANIYRPLPDLIKSNLGSIKKKDIVSVLRSMYFSCKICDARSQIHLTIPQKIIEAHQLNNKRFDSCVEIKKLVITPTRGYYIPCGLELSNRVLREFGADSFIIVSFTDEGTRILNSRMLNFYTAPKRMKVRRQRTSIYQRIENILTDGCTLGNEHFVFLAFSNSQLKDRSAWFTTKKLVSEIRSWMGDFRNLNVAKCSARMGLCFSSTYETINVPSSQVLNLLDIKCNNYVFSDGIGKISSSLAAKVAKKLQLSVVNAPSAYQIRYGGYKGVVTCWPEDRYDGIHLFLRNSMLKFQSEHTTLEVCSWSKYHACFLNRQIIVLLSTLGIQDDVFIKLQQAMVRSFDINLANNIRRSSAETINAIKMMLEAGFQTESEPFLEKMVYCRKLSGLQGLKNKARIYVPDGRLLMGCLDELNILEAGQCFIKVSSAASYPQVYDLYNINFEVVQGKVAIAKNPCHHPGDIRVLNAVDVKELCHLNDCLVFPQKGKRPHADEASGSDLDGDLYFVTWNEELIPSETFEPMIYSSTKND